MLALGGVFMLVTLAVFALYGVIAAAARDRVLARPGIALWLRRAFGCAFAGLAGKLALTSR